MPRQRVPASRQLAASDSCRPLETLLNHRRSSRSYGTTRCRRLYGTIPTNPRRYTGMHGRIPERGTLPAQKAWSSLWLHDRWQGCVSSSQYFVTSQSISLGHASEAHPHGEESRSWTPLEPAILGDVFAGRQPGGESYRFLIVSQEPTKWSSRACSLV